MSTSLLEKFISSIAPSAGEKRREHRREEKLPVEIEVLSDDTSSGRKITHTTQIKNISAGGIKIVSGTYLPIDTSIRLKISLPKSKKSIHPCGKVVWGNRLEDQEMYEMGIEFTNIPSDILSTLLEHIYSDWH